MAGGTGGSAGSIIGGAGATVTSSGAAGTAGTGNSTSDIESGVAYASGGGGGSAGGTGAAGGSATAPGGSATGGAGGTGGANGAILSVSGLTNTTSYFGGYASSGGGASATGTGVAGGGGGGEGGYGLILTAASGITSFTNSANLYGGFGGYGGSGAGGGAAGTSGDGGVALYVAAPGITLTNTGSLSGGSADDSTGIGGVGLLAGSGLTLIDRGTIAGGDNDFGYGGTQADAVAFTGGANTIALSASNLLSGGISVATGASLTFNQAAGQFTNSLTLSNVIEGGGSIIKNDSTVLDLTGINTYTGGTTLDAGTLELAAQGAAGTASGGRTAGGVAFGARGTTLQIDNAALTPANLPVILLRTLSTTPPASTTTEGSYAGPVTNFASGETLDLSGLTYVPGSTTASLSGTTLTVTNGALTDTVTNFTLGAGLTDGYYTFATAQDANTTSGTDVTLSLNAPSAPTLAAGQDTGTSSTDGLTDKNEPTFTGTGADPNSTITLYDGTGTTAIGSGTSDASGNYTASVTTPLADGAHSITATVTDIGNDVSARSTATSITIDTTPPTVTALAEGGPGIDANGNGDLNAGKTVTLTVTTSEPVTVSGGTPTLTLNDGGIATYTGGSGTTQQTFSYTVAAGQNIAALAVTQINPNGAAVADAAGNPLNPSIMGASVPSGTLIVDTTPPTATSVTDTVAQGSSPTPISLAAPSDNLTSAGNLAIMAGALPTDGLVTLANGTPVVSGQALTAAQITGLLFTPAGRAGQTSAFTYSVTDGAGNASQGTATLNVSAPNTPPTTMPTPGPTPAPVPDSISIDQQVSYDGSAFAITGTVSSATGVRSVEITAQVDGVATDLGPATVNANGTFVFSDLIGAHTQGFITATETNGVGGAASAQANYSLQGGLDTPDPGRAPLVAEQDVYNADGSATTSVSSFRGDGSATNDASRRTDIMAAGQTFTSDQFDDFKNNGAPDTTFVFNPNHGLDTISLFRVDGADHDSLSFKGSDFGNSIANVLNDTYQTKGGSSVIYDPTTGDTVKLTGITKQQLAQNQGDIALHA